MLYDMLFIKLVISCPGYCAWREVMSYLVSLSELRAACQNFVGLASDPTLTAAFGITETRRLQLVHTELQSAIAAVVS